MPRQRSRVRTPSSAPFLNCKGRLGVKRLRLPFRIWYHSQVVRQRSAKPSFPGSNPGGTSKLNSNKLVWRNGRRTGLKILRGQLRVGSSPTTSTINRSSNISYYFFYSKNRANFLGGTFQVLPVGSRPRTSRSRLVVRVAHWLKTRRETKSLT